MKKRAWPAGLIYIIHSAAGESTAGYAGLGYAVWFA